MQAPEPLPVNIELARATETDDPSAPVTGRQDCVLRVQGGGDRRVSLTGDDALPALLERVRQTGRAPEDVARLGSVLRRFLTEGDGPDTAEDIQDALAGGREVILRFRSAAAELFARPFELLTMRSTEVHLGERPGVRLRCAWPETETLPCDQDHLESLPATSPGLVGRVAEELVGTRSAKRGTSPTVIFSAGGTWRASTGDSGAHEVVALEGLGALVLDGKPAALRVHSGRQGIAIDGTDRIPTGTCIPETRA